MTYILVMGAGYIGSHTCLALAEKPVRPCFNNLVNGPAEFTECGHWSKVTFVTESGLQV
jgi:UDP-glucose 4-epimerase